MTSRHVVFRREALQQLEELYDYIADAGSAENAARYTNAIVTYCDGLSHFPRRGTARDDIRPGLRTIGYRKRVVIAFAVLDDTVARFRREPRSPAPGNLRSLAVTDRGQSSWCHFLTDDSLRGRLGVAGSKGGCTVAQGRA